MFSHTLPPHFPSWHLKQAAALGLLSTPPPLNNSMRCILFSLSALSADTQVVSFIAGGGATGTVSGYSNGVGSSALFNFPLGVAISATNNSTLYVADMMSNAIRAVSLTTGAVSVFAGRTTVGTSNGVGSNALFNQPSGVALAADGTLYVSDRSNHKIRAISAVAAVTTVAGGGSTAGTASGTADGTGSSATFNEPIAVAVAPSGSALFVADFGNNLIRAIALPSRAVTTLAGGGAPGGTAYGSGDGIGSNALFNGPAAVAVDAAGVVYVVDQSNHKVRAISVAGEVSTLAGGGAAGSSAGSSDGVGTAALFNLPAALALSAFGVAYVADAHSLRSIETWSRTVTTLAGGSVGGAANGVGTAARFNTPSGLAVSAVTVAGGVLYVADTSSHALRAVSLPPSTATATPTRSPSASPTRTPSRSVSPTPSTTAPPSASASALPTGTVFWATCAASAACVPAAIQVPVGRTLSVATQSAAAYANSANYFVQAQPPADGVRLRVTYTAFATEAGWDFSHVFSGAAALGPFHPAAAGNLQGAVSGTTAPAAVTAGYGEKVVLQLHTDSSLALAGIAADIFAEACPAGLFCPAGAGAGVPCPAGAFCPLGSASPVQCAPGSVCATAGLAAPAACPAGTVCPSASMTVPFACPCPGACTEAGLAIGPTCSATASAGLSPTQTPSTSPSLTRTATVSRTASGTLSGTPSISFSSSATPTPSQSPSAFPLAPVAMTQCASTAACVPAPLAVPAGARVTVFSQGAAAYANSANYFFHATSAPGARVTVTFSTFATEANYDHFYVFSGSSGPFQSSAATQSHADVIAGPLSGGALPFSTALPGAYGTAVVLQLFTDGSVTGAGVSVVVSAELCPAGFYCETGAAGAVACPPLADCPAGTAVPPSASPTPTPSGTASSTTSAPPTPSPTPTPTQTPSRSVSPSTTTTLTATPTASVSLGASASATPSVSGTASDSPSATATATDSDTSSPSATASPSPTTTESAPETPSPTPSADETPSTTVSAPPAKLKPSPSATPSVSGSSDATPSPSPSPSPSPTRAAFRAPPAAGGAAADGGGAQPDVIGGVVGGVAATVAAAAAAALAITARRRRVRRLGEARILATKAARDDADVLFKNPIAPHPGAGDGLAPQPATAAARHVAALAAFSAVRRAGDAQKTGVPTAAAPPEDTPPVAPLPHGWVVAGVDAEGDRWYENTRTGETTWELPGSDRTGAHAGAAAPQPAAAAEAEIWILGGVDADGDRWYENTRTGETSWLRPEEIHVATGMGAVGAPPNAALPVGWREVSDGQDTWYEHGERGETTWVRPL
jgi:hypothetical protein